MDSIRFNWRFTVLNCQLKRTEAWTPTHRRAGRLTPSGSPVWRDGVDSDSAIFSYSPSSVRSLDQATPVYRLFVALLLSPFVIHFIRARW